MGVFFERFKNREVDWWQRVTSEDAAMALGELNTNDDEWSKAIANGDTEADLILRMLIGRSNDGLDERPAWESSGAEFTVPSIPQSDEELAEFHQKRTAAIQDIFAREDAMTLRSGDRSMRYGLGSMPDPDLELAVIGYRERVVASDTAEDGAPAPSSGTAQILEQNS